MIENISINNYALIDHTHIEWCRKVYSIGSNRSDLGAEGRFVGYHG